MVCWNNKKFKQREEKSGNFNKKDKVNDLSNVL